MQASKKVSGKAFPSKTPFPSRGNTFPKHTHQRHTTKRALCEFVHLAAVGIDVVVGGLVDDLLLRLESGLLLLLVTGVLGSLLAGGCGVATVRGAGAGGRDAHARIGDGGRRWVHAGVGRLALDGEEATGNRAVGLNVLGSGRRVRVLGVVVGLLVLGNGVVSSRAGTGLLLLHRGSVVRGRNSVGVGGASGLLGLLLAEEEEETETNEGDGSDTANDTTNDGADGGLLVVAATTGAAGLSGGCGA